MPRKGLTLVELLIVIGAIAVLAGLLFPVFSSVRERARLTHCVNSLKQVGAALHMYAQDHDGYVPPYTNVVPATDEERNLILPNADNPVLFKAAFLPYTKDWQVWYCPNDPFAGKSTREPPKEPGPPTWRGFMWNTALTMKCQVTWFQMSMQRRG